jgi:hypothetical protein
MIKEELKRQIDLYITDATDILEENGLEWQDEFLNPKDYSPDWDFGMEDDIRWFNIIIGRILMCYELLSILNQNPDFKDVK